MKAALADRGLISMKSTEIPPRRASTTAQPAAVAGAGASAALTTLLPLGMCGVKGPAASTLRVPALEVTLRTGPVVKKIQSFSPSPSPFAPASPLPRVPQRSMAVSALHVLWG